MKKRGGGGGEPECQRQLTTLPTSRKDVPHVKM